MTDGGKYILLALAGFTNPAGFLWQIFRLLPEKTLYNQSPLSVFLVSSQSTKKQCLKPVQLSVIHKLAKTFTSS